GEGQEVLHAAAAAGDDDDVDLRVLIELGEVPHHTGDRIGALHGAVADLELRGRPPQVHTAHDVLLRSRVTAGDETDAIRQERQTQLPARVEETLCRQLLLQTFESGEQFAQPHCAD